MAARVLIVSRRPGGSLETACLIYLERESMKNLLMRLWKEEEGQDLTEYALLLVLLSLAAIGSIGGLATAINKTFSNAAVNLGT